MGGSPLLMGESSSGPGGHSLAQPCHCRAMTPEEGYHWGLSVERELCEWAFDFWWEAMHRRHVIPQGNVLGREQELAHTSPDS